MSLTDWRAENARRNFTTHGLSNTPEHKIWQGIRKRCLDPGQRIFKYYGGRGIKLCARWNDFAAFLVDMGPKPGPQFTIERSDVNGDYTPTNCVWATMKQQNRNRRNNVTLRLGDTCHCVEEWAERLAVPSARIRSRKRMGWTDERALLAAPLGRLLTLKGVTKPLRVWAKETGIGYRTIWYRLSKGWSHETALTTPTMNHSQAGKLCTKNHK